MPNDFAYCPDGVPLENRHVNQILLQLTGKLAQGIPMTFRGSSGQALLTINDTGVKVSRNGIEAPSDPYVPIGGVILWDRPVAEIPPGWAICDGLNGTTDLRDRFPIGVGTIAATRNATGGAATVDASHTHGPGTLAFAGPSHTHTISTATGQTLGDGSFSSTDRTGSGTAFDNNDTGHTHGLNHAHGGATGSGGTGTTGAGSGLSATAGSTTQSNLPPYIGVLWIRRQV